MLAMKNVTFTLPVDLMEDVRGMVTKGYSKSINNLVRDALFIYIKDTKKQEVRQAMLRASNDPLFLADVDECSQKFRHADEECTVEW